MTVPPTDSRHSTWWIKGGMGEGWKARPVEWKRAWKTEAEQGDRLEQAELMTKVELTKLVTTTAEQETSTAVLEEQETTMTVDHWT